MYRFGERLIDLFFLADLIKFRIVLRISIQKEIQTYI